MTYMTVREFAKELRVCRHTIQKSIKKGQIFAIRAGSGIRSPFRIPKTELERLHVSSMYQSSEGK